MAEDRTFTQEEVNEIISKRLNEEKAKVEKATAADLEKREKELAARELNIKAREVLQKAGLSLDLLEALNLSDETTMTKSIDLIAEAIRKAGEIDPTKKFKGFVPGASISPVEALRLQGEGRQDSAIRTAMGLEILKG